MKIYDEIQQERDLQDQKWGGTVHDDKHTSHDWVAYLVKHVGLAVHWPFSVEGFRRQMIRVAALAVAATAWCDRQTKVPTYLCQECRDQWVLSRTPIPENILRNVSSEWSTTAAKGEVTCHTRMVGGVLCRWWGDGPTPPGVKQIDAAADIAVAAAASTDGWIAVADRLPPPNTTVIVPYGIARLRDGVWYTGMEQPLFMREIKWPVTHWRLFPELPVQVKP